jgi:hypothetical protein
MELNDEENRCLFIDALLSFTPRCTFLGDGGTEEGLYRTLF